MNSVHSSREAGSAQGPPSATERRECKSRVTLLLRDADSGQIDHMAAEPTHGPHHPCTSSSRLGARGTWLAIGNLQLNGGKQGADQMLSRRECSAAGSALTLLSPPPSAVHGHSVRACTSSVGQRLPVDARAECLHSFGAVEQ